MKQFLLLCIFQLILFSVICQEKRLALVIGNANYDKGKLKNPINDALLMKETLEKLNFEVILDTNIRTRNDLLNSINLFGEKRKNYSVGFVYYAGHGIQIDGENYLLATQEKYASKINVKDNGVNVKRFSEFFELSKNEINILVLDACRNNPFEINWVTSSRGVEEYGLGLASLSSSGNIIAFSTSAGTTAKDGEEKANNSSYCISLVRNMMTPDLDLDQIFRNVRKEVREISGGIQLPTVDNQYEGADFYFIKSTYTDQIIQIDSLINVNDFDLALEKSIQILAKSLNNKQALLRRGRIEYIKSKDYNGLHLYKADSLYPNDPEVHEYLGRYYSTIGEIEKAIKSINKAIDLDSQDPELYYWRARFFELNNDFQNAELNYSTAISLDKTNSKRYSDRAVFYGKQNRLDAACQDYTKAIEFDPKNARRYDTRSLFYLHNKQDLEKALDDNLKSIELDPKNELYFYRRGYLYKQLRKFDLSLENYKKAIQINPSYVDAINGIGIIYENLGEIDLAIETYNQGINLEKTDPIAAAYCYNNRALIYEQQGELDDAQKDYSKAIELDPTNAKRYDARSLFYFYNKQDLENAMDDNLKSIELDPKNELYFYRRGYLYQQLRKFDLSLENYKKAIQINPSYVDAINSIGIIYENLGKIDLAIETYNQGINLEKTDPIAAAYCYNNRALIYEQQGKLDDAQKDYSKAIELDPTNAKRYDARSLFYFYNKQDLEKALDDNSKSIELDPKNELYFYRRGYLYQQLRKFDLSIENYKKAIQINPSYVDAINSIGIIYENLGKIDLAIETYNQGINLEKTDPIAAAYCYYNRARIYEQQGKLDDAQKDYSKAIELDPTNAVRYDTRCLFFYNSKQDLEKALDDNSKSIELDPNNDLYFYRRGYLYQQLRKFELSLENYKKVLQINPSYVNAINSIGIIYENRGDIDLAIETYNQGINLEKTDPIAAAYCYYNRARIYEQQGKLDDAQKDYSKAIELDPTNAVRYDTRCLFFYNSKQDLEKALDDNSKSIELDPNNDLYFYRRGYLYQQLRKFDLSLENYKKVLQINPSYVNAINNIGNIYENRGDIDLAIETYSQGITLEKTDPIAAAYCYNNRARFFEKQRKFYDAQKDYSKAIELDPTNAQRYYFRGKFLEKFMNKPYEALVDYSIAITYDSLATYLWWNRGKLFSEKLNNQELAIENFNQILKIKPNDINAMNWMAIFHDRNNDVNKAINGYLKIISYGDSIKKLNNKIEDYGWANINLGEIYQCENKVEEALSLYNEAIDYMPEYVKAYYWRSWFFALYLNKHEDAIADFSQAIKLEPKNPYWYLNRSKIYQLMGDNEKAKNDINYAVKISEESSIYLAVRGNYYSQIKENAKANKDFNKSYNLDSSNRRLSHFITEDLIRQNKIDAAIVNAEMTSKRFLNDTVSFEQLGRLYFEKQDYYKALANYLQAVSIMEFNEGDRTIYPHDIQVFLSDIYLKISDIYKLFNHNELLCETLTKAKKHIEFETRPDRQMQIKIIQEKLLDCQN